MPAPTRRGVSWSTRIQLGDVTIIIDVVIINDIKLRDVWCDLVYSLQDVVMINYYLVLGVHHGQWWGHNSSLLWQFWWYIMGSDEVIILHYYDSFGAWVLFSCSLCHVAWMFKDNFNSDNLKSIFVNKETKSTTLVIIKLCARYRVEKAPAYPPILLLSEWSSFCDHDGLGLGLHWLVIHLLGK